MSTRNSCEARSDSIIRRMYGAIIITLTIAHYMHLTSSPAAHSRARVPSLAESSLRSNQYQNTQRQR
ncbi:hypothetical protein M405DRAFT_587832 [Rhizopogon salebrosus TDB-379]|nr:hypothetical protein M405DRAFT_587832 [Rhizopogon salebrosus TDB-379]